MLVHEPSVAQQDPLGWGQMFGLHVPLAVQVPEVQLIWVEVEQVPAGAQQEPLAWGQMFGEQEPPLEKMFGLVQAD